MFIGTTNTDIDLLDNPLFSINVYEVTEEWAPKISETIKLKQCTEDDKKRFLTDAAVLYYPNALCFEDKSKISLYGNWFDQSFKNIYFSINACNPDTYKGKCVDPSVTNQFFKENIIYFVN